MTTQNTPAQTAAAVKDEGREVGREAAGAARHVTETAVSETKELARSAGRRSSDLIGQLGSGLKDQAGAQQQRLAEGLRSVSGELKSMAEGSEGSGPAVRLLQEAARRTEGAAGFLDGQDPAALLNQVKGYARRRPGAFLAIAAGAGLLAGRLTRGLSGAASAGSGTPRSGGTVRNFLSAEPSSAAGTARQASGGADLFGNDPFSTEPTIPPGTPPVAVDPDSRLPHGG